MAASRERELKLDVPNEFSLIRLAKRLGRFRLSAPELHRLHTTYYDTDDLRLARWGASLRYRQGEGWTLKLAGPAKSGAVYRTEHTFTGDPDRIPDAALDLAAALLRGRQPRPLADLRTLRTQRNVCTARGSTVAEVVEDDVRVLRSNQLVDRFRQLEVELRAAASSALLPRLEQQLRKRGAGKVNPVAKSAIALAEGRLEPALPTMRLHDNATIFELVRATLAVSVDCLVRTDPILRASPNPGAVHDARVAVRKLRSHLRTFAPITDREWADELGERLHWLGQVLGTARDADVLVAGLAQYVERLPVTDRRHAEQALAPYRERRDAAYQKLQHALRDAAYTELLDAMIAAANAPRVCRPQRSAASVVPQLMQRVWKKLRKRVRRGGAEPTDHDLHRIRIQAKHVRYAAEALTPIVGHAARRFARRAEELQALLGKQHDAVAAGIALRAHAPAGVHAFSFGEFAALEQADARRYRERFPRCWQHLARPKRRRFWV
jgi:CHAD domain-containing protein